MAKYYVLLEKDGYCFRICFETYNPAVSYEIGRNIAKSFGASFLGVEYAD